jgi:UDP-glucose 4-epimerase
MSVYGLTKLIDEIVLKKYDKVCGIKSIALRYFNVCGADPEGVLGDGKPNPTNLMTLTIWQALGKKPNIEIFGQDFETKDGTGVRDYIHPSDLATGHIKALEYLIDKNIGDVFNLGTGSGSSVLEVISAVEKACSKKIITKNSPRRSGDPAVSVANSDKAQNVLNWKAKYNLADMAETAWKWHSMHPDGYAS